jgi:phosphate starvation-inducible PhoH-like protein
VKLAGGGALPPQSVAAAAERAGCQREAADKFHRHDILFLIGPAGCGKSHVATQMALRQMESGQARSVIVTRPPIGCGNKTMGYLPGTQSDKMRPWISPFLDVLRTLVGTAAEKTLDSFEPLPLEHTRGRSQPTDELVLTPTGFKPMGSLVIGSRVIGSDGKACNVTGVFPQGELDVYRVSFSDGTSVECSADHLWSTTNKKQRDRRSRPTVRTTAEMMEDLFYLVPKREYRQYRYEIPMAAPVNFESRGPLPLDPYLLGALLGDGSMHRTACVTIASADEEMAQFVEESLPVGVKLSSAEIRTDFCPKYRLTSGAKKRSAVKSALGELGLLGTVSTTKFIPEVYKYAGVEQRISLLRGLMDTDGCVWSSHGSVRVQFYSTSNTLAEDVKFLVESLGGTASVRRRDYGEGDSHHFRGRDVTHNHPMYVLEIKTSINPFRLARKAEKFTPSHGRRFVRSIELAGRKPCQCISVDAADSLYVTRNFIVTHNTFDRCVAILDEAQNASIDEIRAYLTRIGVGGKVLVCGDPGQSDIAGGGPHLDLIADELEKEGVVGVVRFPDSAIVRHPLIATIEKVFRRIKGTKK